MMSAECVVATQEVRTKARCGGCGKLVYVTATVHDIGSGWLRVIRLCVRCRKIK